MRHIKKQLLICLAVYVSSLVPLGGCATPTPPPDVGRVVIAPQVTLPAPPVLVQTTEPKPVGYFHSRLLSYFGSLPAMQTTSTSPTPVVGQMPMQ